MSFKRKAVVSAVGNDSEQEVTDSDVESANRVTEEQVCASKIEQGKEELGQGGDGHDRPWQASSSQAGQAPGGQWGQEDIDQ